MTAARLFRTPRIFYPQLLTAFSPSTLPKSHRYFFVGNSADSPGKSDSESSPNPAEGTSDQAASQNTTDAEKDAKIKELTDLYKRSLAEQENLRTRTRTEVESAKLFAVQKLSKDLLDTVDVVDLALQSIPESAIASYSEGELRSNLISLYKGVRMMEVELLKTLKRHGIERLEPIGQPFDPNHHDALFQAFIPDKTPGTVFSVQKNGFSLNGRVIRPAQVGVVKANS